MRIGLPKKPYLRYGIYAAAAILAVGVVVYSQTRGDLSDTQIKALLITMEKTWQDEFARTGKIRHHRRLRHRLEERRRQEAGTTRRRPPTTPSGNTTSPTNATACGTG